MFRTFRPYLRISLLNERTFYEQPRSGYPVVYHKRDKELTLLQRFRKARHEFKDEWNLFIQEIRSDYKVHPLMPAPYEHDILWKFDGNQKSLDYWSVNSDSDYHHGHSIAKLDVSSRGTGIFHGILDTRPVKDGRTVKSGYCNITSVSKVKSFKRKIKHDWSKYNELVFRIRGDGRCYIINILQKGYWDIMWNNAYHYLIYTRGGPYWQVVKIPFAKFAAASKGELEENQFAMPENEVTNVGITIADKKPGPFRLEIDYIAVCFNPDLTEEFAYEMYDVPNRN